MPIQQRRYAFKRSQPRYGATASRKGRGPNKQNIHASKFVKAARMVESEQYVAKNKFSDFVLHPILQTNIISKGFITPSHVQDVAIPHGLAGRDVVGIANTGTGKTTAFALPLLNKLIADKNSRAIIIAPTRELAQQIEVECRSLARGSGLSGAVLIGGSSMSTQIRDLREKPSIVIGTPGRIKDHVQRGLLNLGQFNIVVLDEVDRMVDMGFINDIRFLLGEVAADRQSLFFSATLDRAVEDLVHSFLKDPVTVSVKTGETSDNVEQDVVSYKHRSEKIDKLHDVLNKDEVVKALIFDETQRNVERLSDELYARGFKVDALHGGKSQGQRQRALQAFRDNKVKVLVATDVAARGIDIVDITHVINFSTPNTYDDYTHRIGRAGRAGRKGYALTFVEEQASGYNRNY